MASESSDFCQSSPPAGRLILKGSDATNWSQTEAAASANSVRFQYHLVWRALRKELSDDLCQAYDHLRRATEEGTRGHSQILGAKGNGQSRLKTEIGITLSAANRPRSILSGSRPYSRAGKARLPVRQRRNVAEINASLWHVRRSSVSRSAVVFGWPRWRVRAADDFNAAATTSNALTSSHRLLAAPSEILTAWGAASSTPNRSAVTMAWLCR